MKTTALTPQLEALLRDSPFAYLCTVDASNQPHVTPIFFTFDFSASSLYFAAFSATKKLANLRVNHRLSLTVDIRDPVDPLNNFGVLIRGEAEILGSMASLEEKELEEWKPLLSRFEEKYPRFREWLRGALADVKPACLWWVRVKPSKITAWKGPRFEALASRWEQ
ncbi:pyridoxamine 5'-phosphate oxidase family protein [Candidatus Hecatella orcuttiae]|uniref:pyridoxamine 5'-phosphate oxidase family protein n=1 Tax=Candidatus Hecatella orcuttiae TaxID=1935119 RepID=UPI00286824ED|nr:pyridoxamine 5'-phosphate oxidase family protein [Candidatus Hecatella orcuttiae]